jgi:Holliday junction resolvase RusA-like endonuclease
MTEIAFTITRPPSTNSLFANVPGKGRIKTTRYKRWIEMAGKEMLAQGSRPRFDGPVAMVIEGVTGIDLDNVKAIPDLMKHMGVLSDDRIIEELRVCRAGTCGAGKVRVSIWSM